MGFGDIFKNSFLEGYQASDITTLNIVLSLGITTLIGLFIFLVYRLTTRKIFYSLSFNISLVLTSITTAAIIFTIQSSVVISLGMVGALSIVRFRTAVKDPLDLVFLFWSISNGIICGAGLAQFSIILSLLITIVLVVLLKVKDVKKSKILVVNADSAQSEDEILDYLKTNIKKFSVKSKTITNGNYCIVVELNAKDDETIVTDIEKMDGVNSISLVTHDGDATF